MISRQETIRLGRVANLCEIHTAIHFRYTSHTPHTPHASHASHCEVGIFHIEILSVLFILIDPLGKVGPDEGRLLLNLLKARPILEFLVLLKKDQVEGTSVQKILGYLVSW